MPEIIPQFLKEMLVNQYGQETTKKIIKGYVKKVVTIRINTIKTNKQEIIDKLKNAQIEFDEIEYNNNALIIRNKNEEDLRKLGTGFRDKRIYNTTKKIYEKEVDLDEIKQLKSSEEIEEKLLTLDGVGNKVANCIMLFSLKRYDVFPIDVWVRRVMNDLYLHKENEKEVDKKELQAFAEEKYKDLAGLAQQYLFYWRREDKTSA